METIASDWSGDLTIENAEQVATILRALLDGKKYTLSSSLFETEKTTGQMLRLGENGSGIDEVVEDNFASILICMPKSVLNITTHKRNQEDTEESSHFRFTENEVTIGRDSHSGIQFDLVLTVEENN